MRYTIIGLVIIILFISFLLYKCHFGATSGQRVMPTPTLNPDVVTMVFSADAVMDAKKLFLTRKLQPENFPSMFTNEQREILQKQAREFYKTHFGLSDTYLNIAMSELRVNPESGYHTADGKSITDGGFVVPVPKGMKLYGEYGGKSGVAGDRMGMAVFGHYVTQNGYRILYKSDCPMVSFSTYDGNYSPIDCSVEIIQSHNAKEVGLRGKATGLYKNAKLDNGLNSVVIRNVLTLQ